MSASRIRSNEDVERKHEEEEPEDVLPRNGTTSTSSKYVQVTTVDLNRKLDRLNLILEEEGKKKGNERTIRLQDAIDEVQAELENRKKRTLSEAWRSRAKENQREYVEKKAGFERNHKKHRASRRTGKDMLLAAQEATRSRHKNIPHTPTSGKKECSEVLDRPQGSSRAQVLRTPNELKTRSKHGTLQKKPGATIDTAMELISSDEEGEGRTEGADEMKPNQEPAHAVRRSPRVNAHKSLSERLRGLRVLFPPSGTVQAVQVTAEDLAHLEPEEFLNDTIIDFYIRYIEETMVRNVDKERLHFFNTFFYKKLTQRPESGTSVASAEELHTNLNKRRHERVKKWTRKVDLFSKDYIFVPIHSAAHWSLAIICHPGANKHLSCDKWPCILHLDSMRGGHSTNFVTKTLREYLEQEWASKMQQRTIVGEGVEERRFSPDAIVCRRISTIPTQNNNCDCGLFLLSYVEHFLRNPPASIRPDKLQELSQSEEHHHIFTKKWFSIEVPSQLRSRILTLILNIYVSQGGAINPKHYQMTQVILSELAGDCVSELPICEATREETNQSPAIDAPHDEVSNHVAEGISPFHPRTSSEQGIAKAHEEEMKDGKISAQLESTPAMGTSEEHNDDVIACSLENTPNTGEHRSLPENIVSKRTLEV